MLAQREVDPNDPLINFGFFNVDATTKGILDDMWVSLDPDKIPHLNDIYPQYVFPDNKGVAWGISQVGLVYNTELVEEPPTSWMDVFHPRFKGKVTTYDYAWGYNGFVATAYALGGDEENMDEAKELWAEAARNGQFHSFFDSNQVGKDLLTRGEATLMLGFTKMAIPWKEGGAPVDYALPEEGVGAFPLAFQIVKGSTERQIDVASQIIDIYLSPETLSRYCNLTATTPTSKYAKLDKDLIMEPCFQPEVTENAWNFDWVAIANHNAEWKEWWDREIKAHM
jgi:putative spermidine/putrescine transport system substrate-binding protein